MLQASTPRAAENPIDRVSIPNGKAMHGASVPHRYTETETGGEVEATAELPSSAAGATTSGTVDPAGAIRARARDDTDQLTEHGADTFQQLGEIAESLQRLDKRRSWGEGGKHHGHSASA